MTSHRHTPTTVEKVAHHLADQYRRKRYGLGQPKKTPIWEILDLINDAEAELAPEVRSQLRPRLFELLNFPTDRGLAHDRIRRDFPG